MMHRTGCGGARSRGRRSVVERTDYKSALCGCFEAKGWCSCCTAHPISEVVGDLLDLAESLPEGAVIERRVNYVEVRALVRS
jgi:hypothetical protein